jgi:sulfur transfer protein SufE
MEMPLALREVIEAFEAMPDRRSRLEHLIELGGALVFDPTIAVDANRVHGCVSAAYVSGSLVDGRMVYSGWADALIVRGFVKLLIDAFDGWTPDGMVANAGSVVEEFLARTQLDVSMIESRANTFGTLFARMVGIAGEFR